MIDVSTPSKRPREPEGVLNGREVPFAVVDEQQRVGRGRHDEILIAVVIDVGKERLRRVIEDADARLFRDVLERRIAAIPVEAIGQSGRLSDVQIVESISVRISDRDALMAVRVAGQDRVERRHPRVEIDVELAAERVVATERRRGDLGEDWVSRAADQMRRGRPSHDLPAGRVSSPSHLPLADVLDAVRFRSGADDVVADGGAEARRRISRTVRFDGGDEELRDGDVTDIVDEPPQFRAKRASVEREIARQILRPFHIERR